MIKLTEASINSLFLAMNDAINESHAVQEEFGDAYYAEAQQFDEQLAQNVGVGARELINFDLIVLTNGLRLGIYTLDNASVHQLLVVIRPDGRLLKTYEHPSADLQDDYVYNRQIQSELIKQYKTA